MTDHLETQPIDLRFDQFPDGRSRYVVAAFDDLEDATEAAKDLEHRGYDHEQISLFMSAETRGRYIEKYPELTQEGDRVFVSGVELDKQHRTLEGAGAGGAIGGVLGAVGAAVLAVGTTLIVPPLGIAVAGPLAAALAGAGAGAAAGGLVGALAGAGMSQYRARRFEEFVKKGHIMLAVRAKTIAERTELEDRVGKLGGNLLAESE
jgi:hypothetical protein